MNDHFNSKRQQIFQTSFLCYRNRPWFSLSKPTVMHFSRRMSRSVSKQEVKSLVSEHCRGKAPQTRCQNQFPQRNNKSLAFHHTRFFIRRTNNCAAKLVACLEKVAQIIIVHRRCKLLKLFPLILERQQTTSFSGDRWLAIRHKLMKNWEGHCCLASRTTTVKQLHYFWSWTFRVQSRYLILNSASHYLVWIFK